MLGFYGSNSRATTIGGESVSKGYDWSMRTPDTRPLSLVALVASFICSFCCSIQANASDSQNLQSTLQCKVRKSIIPFYLFHTTPKIRGPLTMRHDGSGFSFSGLHAGRFGVQPVTVPSGADVDSEIYSEILRRLDNQEASIEISPTFKFVEHGAQSGWQKSMEEVKAMIVRRKNN